MDQEIKAIVTDIEGTTSALSFVKETLFPYAYRHLPDFVYENEAEIAHILDAVKEEEKNHDLSLEELIDVMLRYIDEDQKVTPLKELQGMIWEDGYNTGELIGHIYDDALIGLKRWKKQGINLYVYSSGSVPAQKMLFGHTKEGDLNNLFSGYFDTNIGGKKDSRAYEAIAKEIDVSPENILFLSDSTDEIAAASDAGYNVIILDREKSLFEAMGYTVVSSFDDILNEEPIEA